MASTAMTISARLTPNPRNELVACRAPSLTAPAAMRVAPRKGMNIGDVSFGECWGAGKDESPDGFDQEGFRRGCGAC